MKILAADTALGACSAALLDDERVLARRFEIMERGHAEALAPMVEAVMAGTAFDRLDRLAVTTGPGTFTGQRIGLAFMRGLRTALKKPLVGVTSLAAMAEQAGAELHAGRAAAIHDARRGEVYIEIPGEPARLMAFEDALSVLGDGIVLAGTAAPRAAEALKSRGIDVKVSPVVAPDAIWVARLARRLAPTEQAPRPLYLRAPDARLPGR